VSPLERATQVRLEPRLGANREPGGEAVITSR